MGPKRFALRPLQAFVDDLYRYWQNNDRGSFGHEFDEPYNTDEGWTSAKPTSLALKFIYDCLIVLEPEIQVATCASLIKNAKRDAA